MSYQVTSGTTLTASLHPAGVGAIALPDASSGAKFEWYVKVDGARSLVSTVYSPANVSFTVAELGIDVNSLPNDWASGGVWLSVCFECDISFPGTSVHEYGGPASSGGYLYLFQ